MNSNARRLTSIEQQLGDAAKPVSRLVCICPDCWPEEQRAAYDLARALHDRAREADVIEAMTGVRPVFQPGVISVIVHHLPEGALCDVA